MADDHLLLTTPQAAQRLGVSESAIRSAKSRNKDRLLQGTHWISESGRTLWTGTGILALQDLLTACNGSVTDTPALPTCDATVTDTVALPSCDATVTDTPALPTGDTDPINQFADAIAWEVIEHQLPGAIQSSIHRILTDPTAGDRDRLLALLERIGTGVGLVKLSAIFAEGLHQAIAASNSSLKALGGGSDA